MTIRHAYSKREPSKTNITDFGDSLTVQDQAKATDVNNIMKRFQKTGLIDHIAQYEPRYGDFTAVDYHTLKEQTKAVENAFQELPAKVRAQFNQDPSIWLDFISNQENIDDMKDGQIDNKIQAAESGEESSSAASATSNTEGAKSSE